MSERARSPSKTLMVITALAIVVGGIYVWGYMHGNDMSNQSILSSVEQRLAGSKPTPAQLAASLAAAQAKLAEQSAALAAMKADFPSSPALDKQIEDAHAAAVAAVKKTDRFFNDPDSQDPTLKNAATDPAAAAAIASLRARINADLSEWKAAAADPGTTLALSQKALDDLATMQTYLNQLQNYFAALPPSSVLRSDVIIADQSQLADIASSVNDAINEVESVGGPPVIAENDSNASTPEDNPAGGGSNTPQNGGTSGSGTSSPSGSNGSSSNNDQLNGSNPSGSSSNGDQSNGGGSSNGSNGSNSNTPPPVVTVGDVLAAQAAVDQTGGQVQSIEQQINDSNNPNLDSGGSGSGGVNYWGSQGNDSGSNFNDNGSNGNGSSSDYMQYIPPEDQPSSGPRLIQGDNPFQ